MHLPIVYRMSTVPLMARARKFMSDAARLAELEARWAERRRPKSSVLERHEVLCQCGKTAFRSSVRVTLREASTYAYRGTLREREAHVEVYSSDPKGWWCGCEGMAWLCPRCFLKWVKQGHFEGEVK